MFKNYFRVAVNTLLRNKVNSFINIVGLAIGIACCTVIKNLAAEEAAFRAEIKRLAQRAQTIAHHKQRLIEYTLSEMQRTGSKKISNGVHCLRVVKSPLAIQILNADAVPELYKYEVSETKIDKRAIIAHLTATGEIPDGVEAIQREHLRIS